ncbi:MAG: pseudaminic acid synthase [Verrucomicrobiota bacterium]
MCQTLEIEQRLIGPGHPTYFIAEISANHHHNIQEAIDLIEIASECGADAVKIQTYTPDTMTINCANEHFQLGAGTIWEGKNLFELYGEAYTPWDWTAQLQKAAKEANITLFSTPFDESSVDFLEAHKVPAYKIASFELTHIPLLRRIAQTGRPIILSTGMGTLDEIGLAVGTLLQNGCTQLALLKCTSAYPAPPSEANLVRIKHMSEFFDLPIGLSDHTMGTTIPALAVTQGACIVEKHFTKSRSVSGPDSEFSLEPHELKETIMAIRTAEQALGEVTYELTEKEKSSRVFRRSIFVTTDINKGEHLSIENIRIIRPGYGMAPKHFDEVLGRKARMNIVRGTPLTPELFE